MKKVFLIVIFIISTSLSLFADSSVWKIQSDASTIYIGGTCHLLRKSDYPLPVEFNKAYKDSDALVFETDLGKLNSPETLQLLLSKSVCSDGLTLDKVLSQEVYTVLEKFCNDAGIPVANLNQFKPSMVILTFLGLELQKLGINQAGVDLYFYQKALDDKKKVYKLEKLIDQINIIASMGEGNEDAFILKELNEIKKIEEILHSLIDAWRQGDEKKLIKMSIEELKSDYPKLYKTLLVDRNNDWLPKIEELFRNNEKEFILVGVAHLIGDDGILKQMRKKGYVVEKLKER